jgi:Fe-S-cluster containining protein
VKKDDFQAGLDLLKQPVLPLVSMVQFLFQLSGPQAKVAEIIAEMPETVETAYTIYDQPRDLLRRHLVHLQLLETVSNGRETGLQAEEVVIVDESGQPVDDITACAALINQRILEDELEAINSQLCAPCNCTLCCVGPDNSMQQEFFEIPLREQETEIFFVTRHDTAASRNNLAINPEMDDIALRLNKHPLYQRADKKADQCADPALFNWQNGWSMILPKESSCPALENNGRCGVYSSRPQVCRRPQIFGYVLDRTEQPNRYMLRNSLLAVTDCPYVQLLREEIAAYAAACELDCILKENKQ